MGKNHDRDKHPGSATLVVNSIRKKSIRIPHVVKLNGHEQEGLTAASRLDPAERERAEISQWLNHCIDTLNIQVYNLQTR
jgi:CCR4-NOT transcriptional regulation complex NOT5 subunit